MTKPLAIALTLLAIGAVVSAPLWLPMLIFASTHRRKERPKDDAADIARRGVEEAE